MNKPFNVKENTNLVHYLLGAILGVFVTMAMIFIFAAIMLFTEADRNLASPLATVSVAVGTFVAAFYSAFKIGDKGYKVGIIVGMICFALITLVALLIKKGGFTVNSLFHLIIFLLSGIIGGIVGVNRKNNHKYI